MVPVRQGSERLTRKNYLKIGEFTVLEITLLKVIQSKVFDRIVVNSDDPMLEEVASRRGVDFYLRNEELATSSATIDQVISEPVICLNYATMGWHRKMAEKLESGQLFDERTRLVESSKWSSFLLKTKEDLEVIRTLYPVAPDQSTD